MSHNAKGIDWDSQPLGQVSDRSLALKLGVSPVSVRRARIRRGIAPLLSKEEATARASARLAKATELRASGATWKQVEKETGLTESQAWHLRRARERRRAE